MNEQINDSASIYKILHLVQVNGNLNFLLSEGFKPSQVAKIISTLFSEEYLVEDSKSSQTVLTDKAESFIVDYEQKQGKKGLAKHILPQVKYQMTPLGKYDILLPKDTNF